MISVMKYKFILSTTYSGEKMCFQLLGLFGKLYGAWAKWICSLRENRRYFPKYSLRLIKDPKPKFFWIFLKLGHPKAPVYNIHDNPVSDISPHLSIKSKMVRKRQIGLAWTAPCLLTRYFHALSHTIVVLLYCIQGKLNNSKSYPLDKAGRHGNYYSLSATNK